MERISKIDPVALGRPPLSQQEREDQNRDRTQQEKEERYQQLAELCRLGEYDAATQLAKHNSSWGYEIIDGEVVERKD